MTNIKLDSKLGQLEQWMNSVFANYDKTEVRLTTFIDKGILKLIDTNPALVNLSTYYRNKSLGCIQYRGQFDGNFSGVPLERFMQWHTAIKEFAAKWSTVGEFINEIKTCTEEITNAAVQRAKQASQDASMINDMVQAVEYKYRWAIVGTGISALTHETSDVDNEFVISKVFKSGNQYYWKFKDGLKKIPIDKDNDALIAQKSDFWNLWWRDNADAVKLYIEAALNVLISNYTNVSSGAENSRMYLLDDVENAMRAVCPGCILSCLSFGQRFNIISSDKNNSSESRKLYPTNVFVVGLRQNEVAKGQLTSMERADLQRYLRKTILSTIRDNVITELECFSNTPNKAVSYLSPLPIPNQYDTEPTLEKCPTWDMVLKDKFPSPRMGKFRLATFMMSILDANNYYRQYLYLVGGGNDGKSTLVNAIAALFGDNSKTGLSVSDFTSEFGLQESIGKRLLVVDDAMKSEIYNFIRSDTVKRFTGAGTGSLMCNVKFAAPVEWRIAGAKLLISTNAQISLWEECDITRMNPLAVKRNFDNRNQIPENVLNSKLLSEKAAFLQWCADYIHYYSNLKSKAGNPNYLLVANGVSVITDEQFDDWYNDREGNIFSPELTHDDVRSMRKEAFEHETLLDAAKPYVCITGETGESPDESTIPMIVNMLFEKGTDNDVVSLQSIRALLFYLKRHMDNLTQFTTRDSLYFFMSGLTTAANTAQLNALTVWAELQQCICKTFNTSCKKYGCKHLMSFKNVRMKPIEGFNTSTDKPVYTEDLVL